MNTIELITAIQEIYLCLFTAQQRHGRTCSANLHIVMLANACSLLGVKNAFKHTPIFLFARYRSMAVESVIELTQTQDAALFRLRVQNESRDLNLSPNC